MSNEYSLLDTDSVWQEFMNQTTVFKEDLKCFAVCGHCTQSFEADETDGLWDEPEEYEATLCDECYNWSIQKGRYNTWLNNKLNQLDKVKSLLNGQEIRATSLDPVGFAFPPDWYAHYLRLGKFGLEKGSVNTAYIFPSVCDCAEHISLLRYGVTGVQEVAA